MNYDQIVNAPSKAVAQTAMQLVDRLQDHPPALQSVAAAVLFLEVCHVHRLNPQDVFTAAGNLLADSIHGQRVEFRALRSYFKHELGEK